MEKRKRYMPPRRAWYMTSLVFRREPGMNGSTLKVATPMLLTEVVLWAVGALWLYAQYVRLSVTPCHPVLLANSRNGCIPRAYLEADRCDGGKHPTS